MRAGSPWVAFLCRRKGSGSGAAPPPTAPAPWSAESLRADRLLKEAGRRSGADRRRPYVARTPLLGVLIAEDPAVGPVRHERSEGGIRRVCWDDDPDVCRLRRGAGCLSLAGRRPSGAECEHSAERERERYQEDSALHLCPVPSSPSGLLSTGRGVGWNGRSVRTNGG